MDHSAVAAGGDGVVRAAFGKRDIIHVTDEICTIQVFVCVTFLFVSVSSAECDKLRKDGFRSSQYYSQGPTFSDPSQSTSSLQDDDEDDDKKVHRAKTLQKSTHENINL